MTTNFTLVPGIGGSGPDHWQTIWQSEFAGAVCIDPASWDQPDLTDWMSALDRAADAHGASRAVVIAHSLGCLVATRWAESNPDRLAGLFLVAPPNRFAPTFPVAAAGFEGATASLAPTPTLVIGSDDDPYCDVATATSLAATWGGEFVTAGPVGHINSASGLGGWHAGREFLARFVAEIPVES
jgi:uncharacterized protein